MSNIVTFYSYKGGVGRTMAMANVAVLLALRGLKVLVVDWDLEAPGLERYFGYFNVELPKGGGLLPLLQQQRGGRRSIYASHVTNVAGKVGTSPFKLALLPSGRDSSPDYLATLEAFDWEDYFEHGGGDFIEELRDRWRRDYDVTLIDSRTGLSDTGGICTIQLPDIVVALFTANYQSLYGVRDTMELAMAARDRLEFDRMRLRVLPVPARFSRQDDLPEAKEWVGRIVEVMHPFYQGWLAAGESVREMLRDVRIPQVDSFGFGEKLAVVESDAQGRTMRDVYERIADLLLRPPAEESAVTAFSIATSTKRMPAAGPVEGYNYDIFISHAASSVQVEWLDQFVKALSAELSKRFGQSVKIFFDHSEIRSGGIWLDSIRDALLRSRVMMAFITPGFGDSPWCRAQWATFEKREMETPRHESLIVPVSMLPVSMLGVSALPDWVRRRQVVDISDLPLAPSELRHSIKMFDERIEQVADGFVHGINAAPKFDPAWTVIDPDDAWRSAQPPTSQVPSGSDLPGGSIGVDAMIALIEKEPTSKDVATQGRELLRRLMGKRDLAGVVQLGRALKGSSHTPETSVMFARALLEMKQPVDALKVLKPLLARKVLSRDVTVEARILSAQSRKQVFIGIVPKNRAVGRIALVHAVEDFRLARNVSSDVSLTVDFLALRHAARRLKHRSGTLGADEKLARKCLKELGKIPSSLRERTFERFVAELNLALGKWAEFEKHLAMFLKLPDLAADELTSLLTQLTDVWDVDAMDRRGRGLLEVLKGRLLSTSGGAVVLDPTAVKLSVDEPMPTVSVQRFVGTSGTKTFQWWKTALQRAQSVGSVCDPHGKRIATCFLVNPRDFGVALDEVVVLTTAHAVSSGTPPRVAVRDISFDFEGTGSVSKMRGSNLLWHSPVDQLDTVIIQLDAELTLPPLPLAPKLPSLEEQHRVYIVGYPGGRELAISFQDNELLDHDASTTPTGLPTRLHYRAATEPGSSGSPVFNERWEVLAVHRSRGQQQPRLNGKPGTYEASEGIGILSIVRAVNRSSDPPPNP